MLREIYFSNNRGNNCRRRRHRHQALYRVLQKHPCCFIDFLVPFIQKQKERKGCPISYISQI